MAGREFPIWLFVGILLFVFGVIVTAASVFGAEPATVAPDLTRTAGAIWGLVMVACGAGMVAWFRQPHGSDVSVEVEESQATESSEAG